jgi:hypothetical protein
MKREMKAFFDKQLQIKCRCLGVDITKENRAAVEKVLKDNMKEWARMWVQLGN